MGLWCYWLGLEVDEDAALSTLEVQGKLLFFFALLLNYCRKKLSQSVHRCGYFVGIPFWIKDQLNWNEIVEAIMF